MKTFLVQFYSLSDLRAEEEIETENEITALAIALIRISNGIYPDHFWITSEGFKIVIKLKEK